MTPGAPIGEVLDPIQDEGEMKFSEHLSKHWNVCVAEEGLVRLLKLVNSEPTRLVRCVLVGATWLWQRQQLTCLTGVRLVCA